MPKPKRKRVTNITKRIAVTLLLAVIMAFIGGCMQTLREDPVSDNLPGIDPNAGVGKEYMVTLYYRLANELLLVPLKEQIVTVRSNELAAKAIIQMLIEGPPASYVGLASVLPVDTRADVTRDEDVLYVTLSSNVTNAANFGTTREEQKEAQRLGIYAIVNSLCALYTDCRVQIMIDASGTGEGTRPSPFQLGFSKEEIPSPLMEPIKANADVAVTPKKIVQLTLEHLVDLEYPKAYELFAEMETGGSQKPENYATFETELHTLGTIDAFTIDSVDEPLGMAPNGSATVTITWTSRLDGKQREAKAMILLMAEGEIFKLGYNSLITAMQKSL